MSVGNHESECHSPGCLLHRERALSLSNFSAYNARWHMPAGEGDYAAAPRAAARAGQAMWSSWNYGPVHFVSINTETEWAGAEEHDTGDSHDKNLPAGHFGEDGEYLAWLEADLKAASEARAAAAAAGGGGGPAWIVAGGHRPYHEACVAHCALFAKYGVDLYLAGHGHTYSRSAPVNGTTWIMAGGAGCDEMAPPQAAQAAAPGFAAPEGSVVATSDHMAVATLKANATTLYVRLLDSEHGTLLDDVVIRKVQQEARRAALSRSGR